MKTEEFERICAYCEHAKIESRPDCEEEVFLCSKKKKETLPDSTCRKFAYDLLKRKVAPRPTLPSLEDLDA